MVCVVSQGETPCGIGTAAGCCPRGTRCDSFGRCIRSSAGRAAGMSRALCVVAVAMAAVGVWWT
jgi:hypothetical protein